MAPMVQQAEIFPILRKKVAIITGVCEGLGKVTASIFLQAGAKVVITDTREDEGWRIAHELSGKGEILFVRTDPTKSRDVQNLIATTVERFGRVDIAINIAALTPDSPHLVEFNEDYWRHMANINLTGTSLCCEYELQQMIKQGRGGSIVNIANVNVFRPEANALGYTITKHALIGLTKHAAREGGPHSVRVNAICPGVIMSARSEAAMMTMGTSHEKLGPAVSCLNRFGLPHEVSHGCLWLSSDASSYVTGVVLPIDGGFTAK